MFILAGIGFSNITLSSDDVRVVRYLAVAPLPQLYPPAFNLHPILRNVHQSEHVSGTVLATLCPLVDRMGFHLW